MAVADRYQRIVNRIVERHDPGNLIGCVTAKRDFSCFGFFPMLQEQGKNSARTLFVHFSDGLFDGQTGGFAPLSQIGARHHWR